MSKAPSTSKERSIGVTASQATVAAAALTVVSALGGAFIQSTTTRDVEAGKSSTSLSLARQEFETKLILKAIETPDRTEAIRNFQFFIRAGFIEDKDGKIANLKISRHPSITLAQNVSQTGRRPPGQPPAAQDEVNPKMFEIASSFVGYSTANVSGTDGGNLAAAWCVNEIARVALGKPISDDGFDDNGLSTIEVFNVLKSRHIPRSIEKLDSGMIIVSPTSGSVAGHIGIVGQRQAGDPSDFLIYSSSSAIAKFSQNYTLKRWQSRYAAIETYFFEVDYKELSVAPQKTAK